MALNGTARSRCCVIVPCRPFASHPAQRRLLSSTTSRQVIRPESPRYIEVPQSLQAPTPRKPLVKGILPIPRTILPENREYKASPEHLIATTPEPKPRRIQAYGTEAERLAWKQRMADIRRRNLREGMTELMARKVQTRTQLMKKKVHQERERTYLRTAPERLDEQLTNPSVSKAIRDALKTQSKPRVESQESCELRAQKVAQQQTAASKRRMDKIHNLYLHARNFIVSEDKLDKEIEKVFGTDEAPVTWAGNQKSIWAIGKPSSTKQLLGAALDQGVSEQDKATILMKERLQKIAGELTGGRISIDGVSSSKPKYF